MKKRVVITGAAGSSAPPRGNPARSRLLVVGIDNLLTGDTANISHLRTATSASSLSTSPTTSTSTVRSTSSFIGPAPASPIDYPSCRFRRSRWARSAPAALGLGEGQGAACPRLDSRSTAIRWNIRRRKPTGATRNPVGPRGVYDEAKRSPKHDDGVPPLSRADTKIVRIFNTYGPRMRLNDGRAGRRSCRRYCGTRTSPGVRRRLADAQLHLHHRSGGRHHQADAVVGNDPVNIGNPVEMTIADRGNVIKMTGRRARSFTVRCRPTTRKQRRPDITRPHLLGWEPKVQLEEGLIENDRAFPHEGRRKSDGRVVSRSGGRVGTFQMDDNGRLFISPAIESWRRSRATRSTRSSISRAGSTPASRASPTTASTSTSRSTTTTRSCRT